MAGKIVPKTLFHAKKPVETNEGAERKFPVIIPLGRDTAMVYLTIKKPFGWKPPEWMIDRGEYRRIMSERGLRDEEETGWVPLSGKMVLPWTYEVDMSRLVQCLIDNDFYIVSAETGIVNGARKVWIGFVVKKYYRDPDAVEFINIKRKVLDWMEKEMFNSDRRMNISIYINPMKRRTGGVDEHASSVAFTVDRDHRRKTEAGGYHLLLNDSIVIAKGPATH